MIKYLPLSSALAALLLWLPSFQAQNALNFDGNNDVVQTNYTGIVGPNNRTFEAWVNVDPNATANTAILDYGLNAVGSRNSFMVGANNEVRFISGGINANLASSNNVVTSGVWTHVAFVLDNGTGYLYVDGVQVATGNLTTVNTPSNGEKLKIGQRVAGGSIPFYGAIDEVRVWDYARSAMEIMNDMNDEFCVIPAGLVAYHKFNEGTPGGNNSGITASPDVSGGGNNGTLSNFSLSGNTSNWVNGVSLGTVGTSVTIPMSACDSMISPSGNYVWTMPGTYMDTIPTQAGCDSLMTIILFLDNSTSSAIAPSACSTYTSPSGNYTWTQTGIYHDTLMNQVGCDSIITINLSINNTTDTIVDTACDTYISPSGNYTWISSGMYLDTIPNNSGCDSILIIDLTIIQTVVSNTLITSACDSYTSPSGNEVWTTSGIYSDTLVSSMGCDSVIPIDLTIITLDTGVTSSGTLLSSDAIGASYQWINCNTNDTIEGATTQSYQPNETGSYAVIVTEDGCTDTSDCFDVTIIGIEQHASSSKIVLYPNPTRGLVTIDQGITEGIIDIMVINAEGKIVKLMNQVSTRQIQLDLGIVPGLYTVLILSNNEYHSFRVMKVK